MSTEVKNSIQELLAESSQFNVNDVLVHVAQDHRKLFFVDDSLTVSLGAFPKHIIRDAKEMQKESGVNSLCMATGTVKLMIQEREVQTPILLCPITFVLDKVANTYSFQVEEDGLFLNPFLKSYLNQGLSIQVPDELMGDLSMDSLSAFLKQKGLEVALENKVIGNFHHHRYQIIKELEELSELSEYSSSLESLFGLGTSSHQKIDFPRTNLFPADTDHERVFQLASESNLAIQGPPGTGKSQVLTNLIGKFVGAKKRTVVISEKHTALHVIQNKLSVFDLDKLCFIASANRMSHSFLSDLKLTWDYFDAFIPEHQNNLRLSEQYEDNLQMTLDLLGQDDLIGGISFHAFQDALNGHNLGKHYFSGAPSISTFLKNESSVQLAFNSKLEKALGAMRKRTLSSDNFSVLDEQISQWIDSIKCLQTHFNITCWEDLSIAMKEAALCQVYENDIYKKYQGIFKHKSRAQKQFIKLRKSYNQHLLEVHVDGSEWKEAPSLQEANSLKTELSSGSFWAKRKARSRWRSISHLPIEKALSALDSKIQSEEKSDELSQILIKFYDLGLENPEIEVSLIHQTIGMFSEDQWSEFEKIPANQRLAMTTHHGTLQDLHRRLLERFQFESDTNLMEYLTELSKKLPSLISHRNSLQKLSESELKTFRQSDSFAAYKALVFDTNFTLFKERFPHFSGFSPSDIHAKVEDIIRSKSDEAKLAAKDILKSVHSTFVRYHELLSIPARKLSEEDKEKKKRLRKGKSILVKEFSKSRSHPSLRELYNSEAREWIQLLKPIWLSNPTQLSKCFPLENNLFDVAIFDEASQIPIQNALGGIQRSRQVIVAGDEHQMGPSSYFTKTTTEPMDLLHQASYSFAKSSLKHHYRSQHPDLIAFSNARFYSRELKAFPSSQSRNKAVIQHHFIEDGTFIERRNLPEAIALKSSIEALLTSSNSIGIVAFSEEQLNCIWDQLGGKLQESLTTHLEKHGGFFKALENVQGDECDRLVISFGYAVNEDGDFHMRFGPMNTANGRKRLNVLLTRAIQSIDFFCSIRAAQFKLSDNESINLLRQWISFSEQYAQTAEAEFPFGLRPKVSDTTLKFSRIQEVLPNARELVTLQRALEGRGWSVSYD
ncbi:MAG: hypothetical protein ACI865_001079 [Flavobacteriaceae bacterium]